LSSLNSVIFRLYPNVEWTLEGDTLDGLYFNNETISKPTKAQIDSAIAEIEAEKAQAETRKEQAKAKLIALGLTSEDLESLGLGHSHLV
jgi:hypothetical protein